MAKTKTAPVTRDNWHSSSTRFDFFRKEVRVVTDWGIEEFSICVQCAALVRQMDEFTHYEWHAREASRG